MRKKNIIKKKKGFLLFRVNGQMVLSSSAKLAELAGDFLQVVEKFLSYAA